jgi:hypothetical protein
VPTAGNLVAGELAINTADGRLFYKDSAGVVQVLGTKGGVGSSTTTQVLYNSSGLVVGSANMVFDGSTLTTLNTAYTGTLTGGTGVVNLGSGQFYKDASGNVGIGTSSPAWKLDIAGTTGTTRARVFSTTGAADFQAQNNGASFFLGIDNSAGVSTGTPYANYLFGTAAYPMLFYTNASERMRIDSSGNVGIGISSPAVKLDVGGNGQFTASSSQISFIDSSNSNYKWSIQGTSSAIRFYDNTAGAERMRIDSSGNLFVGCSTTPGAGSATTGAELGASGVLIACRNSSAGYTSYITNTTGSGLVQFFSNTTAVGSISTNGTTTSYNTSSDYRLKEDIAPMINALNKVSQLKPVTYKWKANGTNSQGFIAHELQAVVPDCVTGEKDAVDAEGNPVYQGIDTSFLVATLTAAIQEQQAMIEELKAKVAALEAA